MYRITRKSALVVSALLVLLSGLLLAIYRPYIYANRLSDFHFADTLTSWIAVPAASLFFWGVSQETFPKCLAGSLIGLLLYEFVGLTFDWYDVMALFLSTIITFSIYKLYKRK